MTYFIVCAFLNALTSGLCGLFVILNKPNEKTNQTFFYYSTSVCIWSTFQFLWLSTPEISEYSLLITRISNIAAIFIPPSFFHFSAHLINEFKRYANTIKIFYFFSIALSFSGFTKYFIPSIEPQLFFPHWQVAGPMFTVMFIEYLIIIGFSLLIIHKKIKTSQNPEQLQLKYVFYGILIAYTSGTTNFLMCYKIPVPPFLNILIPFYAIFITYAALRYKLMNIQIIIKRSLIYTILITIISILYFLSAYFTEHVFQKTFGYQSLLTSLVLATTIALLFIPLRNMIEHILFKGSLGKIVEENELFRQEIIQTEKLRSITTLASGMAHEIKNPLTALKTFSEYLPQKLEDKAFLENFAKIIPREVNRIDTLVHELLDFAKPAPAQLKPTPIHTILNQTLDFLNNDLIKHKIHCHKDFLLQENILLNIDANQLKQALLNILLNAIDAMPNGGNLSISTSTTQTNNGQTFFLIAITDTGMGIAQEDLSHIFDPFFSKKDNGTGLGLSITHEIIKNHNGRILVNSTIGVESTFMIYLPLLPQHL